MKTERVEQPKKRLKSIPKINKILQEDTIHLADFAMGVESLGPGLRSVVWVQGCPFSCAGCLAPDWQEFAGGRSVPVDHLAQLLLSNPQITGLTFSGGEPMTQALPLAQLAALARSIRDLDILTFTGYRYDRLRSDPPYPGVPALLAQVDVLIDGLYVADQNSGIGLRGSANQRIHHLSDRLRHIDFENLPRSLEINIHHGQISFVGIPPTAVLPHIEARLAPYLESTP